MRTRSQAWFLAIAAWCMLAAASGGQVEPITKGQRVFTCGHSFHYWISEILPDVARSAGIAGIARPG